ncbi:hypothetical protein BH10PSE16_BH10PSE16_28250 [soil metagenome]
MHQHGTQGSDDLERLWLQVCASRGTPAPDPAQRGGFLQALGEGERSRLETVLALAARGREKPGDLGLLSWAAACTRPALLSQLQSHGLAFTGAGLFACGLKLRQDGWDMQQRIAQLQNHPEDVDTLRAWLPAVPQEEPVELVDLPLQALAAPAGQQETAPEAFYLWPDDGPLDDDAPGWDREHMNAMDTMPAAPASGRTQALPLLPTRFERQASPASSAAPAERDKSRLQLRLFGKAAAHTLEVTAHRRGGDFMGVHVVSIDSAHALSAGGGYAWERKLVLQLTPEEMPAVVATLIGITPSVRFGHHGATQAKFIELRRQEGGLVLVTGEHAAIYSVPVPTATLYYVLDLFCRAMAMEGDKPVRSVSDILALVKAAHGF